MGHPQIRHESLNSAWWGGGRGERRGERKGRRIRGGGEREGG